MTDKEFKHLGRSELIEIIYELKKEEERLKSELEKANAQLNERNIKIETAGSIAEAALGLNMIFENAQKAADDYLNQIKLANAEVDEKCRAKLENTEAECKKRLEETDLEIVKRWETFNAKTKVLIDAHDELITLLDYGRSKKMKTGEPEA